MKKKSGGFAGSWGGGGGDFQEFITEHGKGAKSCAGGRGRGKIKHEKTPRKFQRQGSKRVGFGFRAAGAVISLKREEKKFKGLVMR